MRIKAIMAVLLLFAVSLSVKALPQPYPAAPSGKRLTPPVPETPSINGASLFGVRPGNPVLIKIAASGNFSVELNPHGCSVFLFSPKAE